MHTEKVLGTTMPPLIDEVLTCQRRASDPKASVWVGASAGSGKTKVLTDRLLRLLLDDVPMERLLCLTFTRAAASEMRHRLFAVLEEWCLVSSDVLPGKLESLTGTPPSLAMINMAKSLFYKLIDQQDRLRIMTLHGFCQSLLQQFPLESGCRPNFSVLDEAQIQVLFGDIFTDLLRSETLKPDFDILLNHMAPERLQEFLEHSPRHGLMAMDDFAQALNLTSARAFILDPALVQRLPLFDGGSSEDQKRGALLKGYDQGNISFQDLRAVFLTQTYTIRSRLGTKAVLEQDPMLHELLSQGAQDYFNALQTQDAVNLFKIHQAFQGIHQAFWQAYGDHKQFLGALDFTEIMERTLLLFNNPEIAPWVLYRVTGGLDHVLIDEAQDTSLLQWILTLKLTEDFFTGCGHRLRPPTLFVVGDLKQSIYGFQGSRPELFQSMATHYQQQIEGSEAIFDEVTLDVSFRSSPEILSLVDEVFAQSTLTKGMAGSLKHHSIRQHSLGSVQRWPLVLGNDDAQASLRCAEQIADFIANSLQHGFATSKGKVPVQPSDFLILVQRRHRFLYQLIRALKRHRVPLMGADRFVLHDELAIKDILSLCRFLLLPYDTFSLTAVLVSPFVGWSMDIIVKVLSESPQQPLWQKISQHPDLEVLRELLKKTDHIAPSELLFEVLYKYQGRDKIVGRLGQDGLDSIDALIQVLMTFEETNPPSLQAFVSWFEGQSFQIKRDVAQNPRNEVRIMTVHGAKGLQAPIVILPDTVRKPDQPALMLEDDKGYVLALGDPTLQPFLGTLKGLQKSKDYAEYQRLLYVALTRAEDHLIVTGWHTSPETPEACWYHCLESVRGVTMPDGDSGVSFDLKIPKKSQAIPLPQFMTTPLEREVRQEISVATGTSAEVYNVDAALRGQKIHEALERYIFLKVSDPLIGILLQNPQIKNLLDRAVAEVPVMGVLQGITYSVRLDCLVVDKDTVKIIDFKSDLNPPGKVPDTYQQQLVLYQGLIQSLYPKHVVETYVLWTTTAYLQRV